METLDERELNQMAALRATIDFGLPPTTWLPTATTPWRILTWDGERLVNHLAIMGRTIAVGDADVHVAGIRSVMTLPEMRGRGVASAAMRRAAEHIEREMLDARFGVLFCLDIRVPLYRGVGWEVVDVPTFMDQPEGRTRSTINTMVKSFRGEPWPPGEIDIRGLPW